MSTQMRKFAGGDSRWVLGAWMALGALAAIAIALVAPADVLAAAGSGGGSGSGPEMTKALNKNGKGGLKDVGVPLFGGVAAVGLISGIFAKKLGFAAAAVAVACVGLAITVDPEGSMTTIGNGITGFFK